jgi:hypothetical protein
MPETLETTPTVVPTLPTSDPVAPLTERERITQKYEQTYYNTPPAETTTDPAPVVTETPAPETPAPPAPAPQPDITNVLSALVQRLESFESRLPAPPAPTPAPETTQEDWLKLLAEGKKTEGEKALINVVGPEIQKAAVQQALSLLKAEQEITSYTTEMRTKNADVMAFESYIDNAVGARLQAANSQGKIKTPADYVTVYKEAVNAEIENARKIALSLRGDGKLEANTRLREVASQPTLQPNVVNTQREAPKTPTEQPVETTEDYFAKRRAQFARNTGIG